MGASDGQGFIERAEHVGLAALKATPIGQVVTAVEKGVSAATFERAENVGLAALKATPVGQVVTAVSDGVAKPIDLGAKKQFTPRP